MWLDFLSASSESKNPLYRSFFCNFRILVAVMTTGLNPTQPSDIVLVSSPVLSLVSNVKKALLYEISIDFVFLCYCTAYNIIHAIWFAGWYVLEYARLHDIASYVDVSLYFGFLAPCFYPV